MLDIDKHIQNLLARNMAKATWAEMFSTDWDPEGQTVWVEEDDE